MAFVFLCVVGFSRPGCLGSQGDPFVGSWAWWFTQREYTGITWDPCSRAARLNVRSFDRSAAGHRIWRLFTQGPYRGTEPLLKTMGRGIARLQLRV